MKKHHSSIVLTVAILVVLTILTANAYALPGSGTEVDPWRIESLAAFDVFADPANAPTYRSGGVYTKLTCDLNLAGRSYTTAVIDGGFYGHFDGNGHVIRNLTIDTVGVGNDDLGLFDYILDYGASASVKNLGIKNVNITGGDFPRDIGGLCGWNHKGTITNCYATGSVTGGDESHCLGGLCGCNYEGTITNCYATGSVTGGDNSYSLGGLCGDNCEGTIANCYSTSSVNGGNNLYSLGGLCGDNHGGTITNCYATGSVTGGDNSDILGGLCGGNGENGTITNCYAAGSVNGGTDSDYLGGLCGYNWEGTIVNCYAAGSITGGTDSLYLGGLCGQNYYSTIVNCYATGSVTGGYSSEYLGGLCGYNYFGTITNCYSIGSVTGGDDSSGLGGLCGIDYDGTISDCFWDVETSGIGNEGDDNFGATGKTTAQMQTESTFTDANWDFSVEPLWHMPFETTGYPMSGWQKDIPGDFTGRYGVDMEDFAVLADTWFLSSGQAGYNELCDLIDDNTIDLADLAVFAENWLCN